MSKIDTYKYDRDVHDIIPLGKTVTPYKWIRTNWMVKNCTSGHAFVIEWQQWNQYTV